MHVLNKAYITAAVTFGNKGMNQSPLVELMIRCPLLSLIASIIKGIV